MKLRLAEAPITWEVPETHPARTHGEWLVCLNGQWWVAYTDQEADDALKGYTCND